MSRRCARVVVSDDAAIIMTEKALVGLVGAKAIGCEVGFGGIGDVANRAARIAMLSEKGNKSEEQ